MKIYDISLPVSDDMVCWEGDPPPRMRQVLSIANGDACNLTTISMGVHTGTHIDAPYHFLEKGVTTDCIKLGALIGECRVVHVESAITIEKEDLENLDLAGCKRLLFKTRNSESWAREDKEFNKDFIALGLSGARYIADLDIDLVGIDYLSIESYHSQHNEVHKTLLEKGVVILEGINLANVYEGTYELICLPIRLEDSEGAPVRAVLRESN
ncbi:MAG: cyclase family protein [Pseudodesulfovibrio sp.]